MRVTGLTWATEVTGVTGMTGVMRGKLEEKKVAKEKKCHHGMTDDNEKQR